MYSHNASQFSEDDVFSYDFDPCRQGNSDDNSGTKNCFLCGYLNPEGSAECCHCRITLTGDPMVTLTRERGEVMRFIDMIERDLDQKQRGLDEDRDIEAYANLGNRVSHTLMRIGWLLVPNLVGIPLLLAGAAIRDAGTQARHKAKERYESYSEYIVQVSRDLSKEYRHLEGIDSAIERLGRMSSS
jgi:hypothetical protein